MRQRSTIQSRADMPNGRGGRWADPRLLAGLLAVGLMSVIAIVGQPSRHANPTASASPGSSSTSPEPVSNETAPIAPPPVASANGPNLTITASSLVFDQGAVVVPFSTSANSVTWTVLDEDNRIVGAGTASGQRGSGNIGLGGLGVGYYTLAVSVGPEAARTTRVTGLAVLGPLPPRASGVDSPFGIGMHISSPGYQGMIPTVAQIGFGHARFDMKWDAVEKSKGSYEFPAGYDDTVATFVRNGITPLPIVDYHNPFYDDGKTPSTPAGLAAFAAYASAVLHHYAGSISNIEVYNEPNLPIHNDSACGVRAECYLPMLQAVYPRVKAEHPDSTIVGVSVPGLPMDWINRLFDLGGLGYLDVVSLHPYFYPAVPEGLVQKLAELRQSIRDHNGGQDKPIWLTELGWPTHEGGGTTESQQADYVVRSEVTAFANGVTQFYWYDLIDDGTNPADKEHHFGLMRPPSPGVRAASPKPSLVTQAVTIRQLTGRAFAGADQLPEPMYSVRFCTGREATRVLWALEPREVSVSTSGPVTVVDEYGRSRALDPLNGTVRLNLNEHPVFVSGPITGVQPA